MSRARLASAKNKFREKKAAIEKELVEPGFIPEIDSSTFTTFRVHDLPMGKWRVPGDTSIGITKDKHPNLFAVKRLSVIVDELMPSYIQYYRKLQDGSENPEADFGMCQRICMVAYYLAKHSYPINHQYIREEHRPWNKDNYLITRFIELVEKQGEWVWKELEHSTAISKINDTFINRRRYYEAPSLSFDESEPEDEVELSGNIPV